MPGKSEDTLISLWVVSEDISLVGPSPAPISWPLPAESLAVSAKYAKTPDTSEQ